MDDLCPDELVDKIGMDRTRRLLRGHPLFNRPCTALVLADGEKHLQAQKRIRFTDQRVEGRLPDPIFAHEYPGLILRELRHLHFDLAEERHHFRVLRPLRGSHGVDGFSRSGSLRLVKIQRDEHRLHRKQLIGFQEMHLFPGEGMFPQRLLLAEDGSAFFEHGELFLPQFIPGFLELFLDPVDARFYERQVGNDEFHVEGADVAERIDGPVGMRHRIVAEEADHLDERVVGLDVRQEIRGELRRARFTFLQPHHIDELDGGVDGAFGFKDRGEVAQARIRNFHDRVMRFNPREGCGIEVGLRYRLKKSRLSRKRQADDADLHENTPEELCGTRYVNHLREAVQYTNWIRPAQNRWTEATF